MRAELMRAIAKGVSKALGAAHDIKPDSDHYARVALPDGVNLGLYMGYGKGARLEVSVSLPQCEGRAQCARDLMTYEEQKGAGLTRSITVNPDRDPAKIAADITRRLLPDARTLTARAVERAANAKKYTDGRIATRDILAKRLRVSVRGSDRMDLYAGGITLNINGPDSVRIEGLYVSGDLAARIVELVMAEKAEKGERDE
jgi:hypothetical protein